MEKKRLKIILISLGVILFFVLVAVVGSSSSDEVEDDGSNYNSDISSTETSEPEEQTEVDKMVEKISALFTEKLAFDSGDYAQGEIPAGEYAFVRFNGGGSYYSEEDAAGNIIDNQNFDSFGYVTVHAAGNIETRGVLVNVSAFERLEVKGAKQLYEVLNEKTDWNQGGYYKVGTDIDPGSYTVESLGSGYWAIISGPVSGGEIVDNDNFNGHATINLSVGQYLELSRAIIIKA